MKKFTLLVLGILLFSQMKAQLTVNATASVPTICLGNLTPLTATASPVSYSVSSITNNPLPSPYSSYLVQAGEQVEPIAHGINLDDAIWDNIPLPFAFTYFGNVYNNLQVCTNGWIGMEVSNTNPNGSYVAMPNAAAPNNVIHALTADLDFRGAGNAATIDYFYTGNTPNRQFVINFENIQFLSPATGTADVQVILYEGTNVIEIHTSSCSNTSVTKAQGVENSTGTVAVASPGRNNTTTWSGFTTAYRFTPDNVNYTWSPSAGLSSTTGYTVTASPTATTTYTVNATNTVSGATGSTTVTVTINPASNVLAAIAGGATICQNRTVSASGTFYRDGNCNLIARVVPAGASPVTNVINTCIKLDAAPSKRGTADLYAARKFDIEPQINAATATANVILYYLQSEFNDFNTRAADSGHRNLPTGPADATGISNLLLKQFHGTGTNPTNYTGSMVEFTTATSGFTVSWNATNSRWEVTVPVTGFSGFYLSSKKVATLGINMDYFKGVQLDKKHQLNWKATCSSTEAKFEVQHSTDGQQYATLNSITASQARCEQPFEFTNAAPAAGNNFYRIKITDVDGKIAYSNIVLLQHNTKRFELVSLSPNIVHRENAVLKINAAEKNTIAIVITDFSGRTIRSQSQVLQPGTNTFSIQTANLAPGAYHVTVHTEGEKPQTTRLIRQ